MPGSFMSRPASPALIAIAIVLMVAFFAEVFAIRLTVPLGSDDRIELWTIAGFVFIVVTAVAAMAAFLGRERPVVIMSIREARGRSVAAAHGHETSEQAPTLSEPGSD